MSILVAFHLYFIFGNSGGNLVQFHIRVETLGAHHCAVRALLALRGSALQLVMQN